MLIDGIEALTIFAGGSALGSFLNVVSLRFLTAQPIALARSRCPHCRAPLAWWQMIPLFSFIAQRGRCFACRAPISAQYPLSELLAGCAALAVFVPLPQGLGEWAQASLGYIFLSLLLILVLIDYRAFLLPDFFLLCLAANVVLLLATKTIALDQPLLGIIVGSGFLLILWGITRGQGIGLGDIKLMVPLGLLFGFPAVVTLLGLAFISGGVFAMWLLTVKNAHLKTAVPFGPHLAASAAALWLWPHLHAHLFTFIWPF